jgi:hypothetical protein
VLELVSSLGKSNGPCGTGNEEVTKLLDSAEPTSTSAAPSGEAALIVFPEMIW